MGIAAAGFADGFKARSRRTRQLRLHYASQFVIGNQSFKNPASSGLLNERRDTINKGGQKRINFFIMLIFNNLRIKCNLYITNETNMLGKNSNQSMNYKYIILSALCMTAFVSGRAQTAHESIISLSKKYKPLFGKETSNLAIDFIRSFGLDGGPSDTVYYLSVKVDQKTTSVEGYTLGTSIFGTSGLLGGSGSASKSYSYNKDNGSITMDHGEFKSLYEAINKVYQYLSTLKAVKKPKTNSLANYTVRDITLAGEYRAGYDSKEIYYFQLGDASFTMCIVLE